MLDIWDCSTAANKRKGGNELSIFFKIRNIRINTDKVRDVSIIREDALGITFDDGKTEIFDTYGDAQYDIEKFEKTIVQLIPCTAPIYNVYKQKDGLSISLLYVLMVRSEA